MYIDFHRQDIPAYFSPPKLYSVYHLEADSSYLVNHYPLPTDCKVLLLTIGGSGYLEWKDHHITVSKGESLLFVPDSHPFSYHTAGDTWNFWWFEFSDQNSDYSQNPQSFHFSDLLSLMCTSCLECLKNNQSEAACALFGSILTQIKMQNSRESTRSTGQTEQFIRIQEIIHLNLRTITVTSLADKTGIGERSLRNLFLRHAGCSPKQYILMIKLDTACYLLRNTSKSIDEISDSLGFSSQFHFSRSFKQRFGSAPKIWRNQIFTDPVQTLPPTP